MRAGSLIILCQFSLSRREINHNLILPAALTQTQNDPGRTPGHAKDTITKPSTPLSYHIYLLIHLSIKQYFFLFQSLKDFFFSVDSMFFSSLVFVEHFFFLLLWNNFFPPQIMKTSVISGAPIGILRTCRLFHWRPPVTQVNITDLISTHLSLTIIDQLHSKCDLHNDQYCPSIVNL